MFTKNYQKLFFSYFLALQFICFCSLASAENDTQLWSAFMANGKFQEGSNWRWSAELQPRIGDNVSYPERLLVRPAVGYALAPNLVLWLGYAWTPLFMDSAYNHKFNDEQRIWQQVTYDQTFGNWQINHRARLEERYIEGVYGEANRLRYLLRVSHPLMDLADGAVVGLTAYDEYFYNLNAVKPSVKSGYDRNRIFFGPYWDNKKTRVEVGYFVETSDRLNKSDRRITALAAYLTFRF